MSYIEVNPVTRRSMSLLEENMLVVTGEITEIGPRIYAGYAPGEEAILHIAYRVAMTRAYYDAFGFTTLCDIFAADGTPIATNRRIKNFSYGIWETSKEWSDSANISLGSMPDNAIEGYFVLKARYLEHWYDLTLTVVELDRKEFHIPLKGVHCCPYCTQCFATYEELVDHIENVHPGQPTPPPERKEVPWGWLAAGGGILAAAIMISKRR